MKTSLKAYSCDLAKSWRVENTEIYLLSCWPGQTLQHLPGSNIGSGHVGLGHSVLMFLHRTRPTILRFLWIYNMKE